MSQESRKSTMQDFGYAFNDDGVLKKINANGECGDEGFQFNVSPDLSINQKHYEDLGDVSSFSDTE